MGLKVEIDAGSGFCGGVIRAISSAEKFLDEVPGRHLFSLGAIVHNEEELARLGRKGLVTIDYEDLADMQGAGGESLLIRAHGEPPQTYAQAAGLGFNVIDCTCPVVLRLQESIRVAYARLKPLGGQVVIFGKIGHAEVLGLVGQVGGDAVVVEDRPMLEAALDEGRIPLDAPVEIFSQTTKSPDEYAEICAVLKERLPKGNLTVNDTVCSQVATRHERLSSFAQSHDVILFVSGKASSNGKVLCELCKSLNIRTYHIGSEADIKREWFGETDRVGVCGATSTPKWLLEKVAAAVEAL
jgi:4-hydroxy-3-methylbut-2-enyl diphosphate reductase